MLTGSLVFGHDMVTMSSSESLTCIYDYGWDILVLIMTFTGRLVVVLRSFVVDLYMAFCYCTIFSF